MTAALLCAAAIGTAMATDFLWLHTTNGMQLGVNLETVDSITNAEGTVKVALHDSSYSFATASIEKATIGQEVAEVTVTYSGTDATVVNPFAFQGVEITKEGAYVTVRSTTDKEVTYRLSGSTTEGQFKIYSSKKFVLGLAGVSITNTKGSAINVQSGKKVTVELSDGTVNTLVDGSKYSATPEGEDEKGCFFSEGQLIFTGKGTLNVTANKKHAIVSDDYIEMKNGTVNVLSSASDGIHVNDYFLMNGGTYTSTATKGDGIDASEGYIEINAGLIDVSVAQADVKGIKCDSIITMTGGQVRLTVSGDQCKGFKTKQNMTMTGGEIEATMSGNAVVVDGDPSYCTVIKTDGDFVMKGGKLHFTHSGKGGKGISTDGNATFEASNVNITCTGNGDTYTDVNSVKDAYSSTCITIDGDLNCAGGTFTLSNSGTAGKCIKVDGQAVFGAEGTDGPAITARTSGERILVSGTTSGGGGRPPGFGGSNADYSNPKVVKVVGVLTVKSGTFNLTGTTEGGEGLESKSTLRLDGGTIKVHAYDDCINAASAIEINGGHHLFISSNNDAVDSNGTISISGGVTIACGSRSPECGFDCDNNRFAITGGVIVGLGGSTSNPTTSACTQPCLLTSRSLAANASITLVDANGANVVTFTNPVSVSGTLRFLLSAPGMVKGQTYKLYTGGTATGGEVFEAVRWGGSYNPGTLVKTITLSSMVTSSN